MFNLQYHTMKRRESFAYKPSWLVRWGLTVYLGILVLVIIFALFVSYPDVIETKGMLISNSYGEIRIPANDRDKIRIAGKILLRFPTFHEGEDGQVAAEITSTVNVQSDSTLLAKIYFPDGLITASHKAIPFEPGVAVAVKVVTEKVSIANRVYHKMFRLDNFRN